MSDKPEKVSITEITITTKEGVTIPLSLEDARDLHLQLDGLFGSKTEYVPGPLIVDRGWWRRPYEPYVERPITWYSDEGGTAGNCTFGARLDSGMVVEYSTGQLGG